MADVVKHRFEDADAPQPRTLGRRGNMLPASQPTATPDTPIHKLDGMEGSSIPRDSESRSIVSSADSKSSSHPQDLAPYMQGVQASASNPSSESSNALHPSRQHRPWEQQLLGDSRSADSLSGSSTNGGGAENKIEPAAPGVDTSESAPNSLTPRQLSLPRSLSGTLPSAAADKQKDAADLMTASLHSAISGARPSVSRMGPKVEAMQSRPGSAASMYAIFSPGQLRHGVQPISHTGSQGVACSEAATAGQAPFGVASLLTETPAELQAEPGPQSCGVPSSRAAAAGSEPEWLHDDLDEMLPDGLTVPARQARPQQVSKAPVRSAVATGSTMSGAKDAAGIAVALIKSTDGDTPLEESAGVHLSESSTSSTEHTAVSAMLGAQPPFPLKTTISSAAAGAQVGKTTAGSVMRAGFATVPSVCSQGADIGGFATMASTEPRLVEKMQSFTPLMNSQYSVSIATAVAGVRGADLKAEILNHPQKWGSDVAGQHSSIDREDRCSILESRLQVADARCAELEAELAAKEAAAQLACSESLELAAKCERLDRHVAEAEAAAQLIRSERSSLEEKCRIQEKEAAGHADYMDALIDERDEASSRCDTLEEVLAEMEICMKKTVADLIQSRTRCEELQQRVQEVEAMSGRTEHLAGKNATEQVDAQRQRMNEESQDIHMRLRQLQKGEAALAAREQLWAAERPRILGAIRRLRSERRR